MNKKNFKYHITNTVKIKRTLIILFALFFTMHCFNTYGYNILGENIKDTSQVHKETYLFLKTKAQDLKLDVFSPAVVPMGEDFPVIVFFHGGGWTKGDRTQFYQQCNYFAKQGFVAITADYRFMNSDTNGIYGDKRICIKDAKSAIRWVKKHASLLKIDTNKVIVGGGSAGGHLATMATIDTKFNNVEDDLTITTKANALMLLNPGYIFPGRNFQQPWDIISNEIPPFIMFYGDKDKWRLTGGLLYNLLKKKGIQGEMWIAKGERHAFANKKNWSLATNIKTLEFLNKLGIKGTGEIESMPNETTLFRGK